MTACRCWLCGVARQIEAFSSPRALGAAVLGIWALIFALALAQCTTRGRPPEAIAPESCTPLEVDSECESLGADAEICRVDMDLECKHGHVVALVLRKECHAAWRVVSAYCAAKETAL